MLGPIIVIVSWVFGEKLSLFLRTILVYDCDSFLIISTGWVVIMIVFWAIENNLVYL